MRGFAAINRNGCYYTRAQKFPSRGVNFSSLGSLCVFVTPLCDVMIFRLLLVFHFHSLGVRMAFAGSFSAQRVGDNSMEIDVKVVP